MLMHMKQVPAVLHMARSPCLPRCEAPGCARDIMAYLRLPVQSRFHPPAAGPPQRHFAPVTLLRTRSGTPLGACGGGLHIRLLCAQQYSAQSTLHSTPCGCPRVRRKLA